MMLPNDEAIAEAAQEAPNLEALNALIAASPPLVPRDTGAVLGEGPQSAAIAFVGEQPGDQEDRQGRPFVGPAGQLLDRALGEAGIDRAASYLTNAVKHFKFEQRGKRRIHQRPTAGEVRHDRWWLERELELVAAHHRRVGGDRRVGSGWQGTSDFPEPRRDPFWPSPRLHHGPPLLDPTPAGSGRAGTGLRRLRCGPAPGPASG